MTTIQEPKYKIKNGKIVNRQSGEAIPDDEPLMIFRARDRHAAHVIAFYFRCVKNDEHGRAVGLRLDQFNAWATAHPDRMKEPDTELNK